MQRWEQNEGHLDVLNYSLKFAVFLVLPGSPGPPTPLPIKMRSRRLAISFGIWETEYRTISRVLCWVPISGLWTLGFSLEKMAQISFAA